ncbi:outer membrane beta-barrel protein [candidate division KSB1 bacterium]|nr:outer membrane beta-barrel protein [candidate division KSB1 bacterium]
MSKFKSYQSQVILIAIFIVLFCASNVIAGGKLGIYFISMVPRGEDADNYSRPGYGGGIHVVAPLPQVSNFIAVTGGFEYINLMSETKEFRQELTQLRIEQQTDQHYLRFYAGGRVGGHGLGFIRPYAGMNLALVVYGIDMDVVIPDDHNYENEINQDLDSENHAVFGSDITLGVDFNFWNKWNLDTGVRYLKSFSVPEQLWEGSEKIHSEYFQFYFGVGVSFRTLRKASTD